MRFTFSLYHSGSRNHGLEFEDGGFVFFLRFSMAGGLVFKFGDGEMADCCLLRGDSSRTGCARCSIRDRERLLLKDSICIPVLRIIVESVEIFHPKINKAMLKSKILRQSPTLTRLFIARSGGPILSKDFGIDYVIG